MTYLTNVIDEITAVIGSNPSLQKRSIAVTTEMHWGANSVDAVFVPLTAGYLALPAPELSG